MTETYKYKYLKNRTLYILKNADEKEIQRYLRLAVSHTLDPDRSRIINLMFTENLTPYEAAVKIFSLGGTVRSLEGLRKVARDIEISIVEFFGQATLDDLFQDILKGEEVHIFPDDLDSLLAKCYHKDVPVKLRISLSAS